MVRLVSSVKVLEAGRRQWASQHSLVRARSGTSKAHHVPVAGLASEAS